MTKRDELLALAERCEKSVEFLATVPMELGLARWSAESSNILECAAALRLSAQQREPVVRVKELEWVNYWDRTEAKTAFGAYIISPRRDGAFNWCLDGVHSCFASSEFAAASAAQADYEQRIMAAICREDR